MNAENNGFVNWHHCFLLKWIFKISNPNSSIRMKFAFITKWHSSFSLTHRVTFSSLCRESSGAGRGRDPDPEPDPGLGFWRCSATILDTCLNLHVSVSSTVKWGSARYLVIQRMNVLRMMYGTDVSPTEHYLHHKCWPSRVNTTVTWHPPSTRSMTKPRPGFHYQAAALRLGHPRTRSPQGEQGLRLTPSLWWKGHRQ